MALKAVDELREQVSGLGEGDLYRVIVHQDKDSV